MISQRIISWVFLAATSITDPSSNNSFGTSELGLGEPKSAHPEGGFFGGDIWFEKTHGGFSKFFDSSLVADPVTKRTNYIHACLKIPES